MEDIATRGTVSDLGTVTSVTASPPLASSGSPAPNISVSSSTGSGAIVLATSPVLVTPNLGTPSAGVATNLTGTAAGLTAGVASAVAVGGITGLAANVASFLATPSSANLAAALTDETGTGLAVFGSAGTTWTPVDASGAGLAFTVNFARYIRLGKLIIAWARLAYPVTADGTAASIGGLPANFVSSALAGMIAGIATFNFVFGGASGAAFNMYNSVAGTAATNLQCSGATVYFFVAYESP